MSTGTGRSLRGPAAHRRGPRFGYAPIRRLLERRDAVQEALVAAANSWPHDGLPDDPLGWLVRVASRRIIEQYRRDDARRRREEIAASRSLARPEPAPADDDTLSLMFMCCHPSLTAASAIPLTLRAVGGLTTREIASCISGYPESTMASGSEVQIEDQVVW